jgi:hypothetical protein
VGLCERLGLELAQPAQTLASHSAWPVTRRRPDSLARETGFVEIGPLTVLGKEAAAALTPFPELRYGWGLDLHWAALASTNGWRLGVVDALPVRHETGLVGAAYPRAEAEAEAARAAAVSRQLIYDARERGFQREIEEITTSIGWRITEPLRRANALRRRARGALRHRVQRRSQRR